MEQRNRVEKIEIGMSILYTVYRTYSKARQASELKI